MIRFSRTTEFLTACILSFAYFSISLLNIVGPLHPPIYSRLGNESHPEWAIGYFILALIITWGTYLYVRNKPRLSSVFIMFMVGIFLILSGVFLWDIAEHYENAFVPVVLFGNH